MNGIDKSVAETSETISFENFEHRVTGKPVAKANPRPMPVVTLSPMSIPLRERKWVEINPEISAKLCDSVKSHDQIVTTSSINSSRR